MPDILLIIPLVLMPIVFVFPSVCSFVHLYDKVLVKFSPVLDISESIHIILDDWQTGGGGGLCVALLAGHIF